MAGGAGPDDDALHGRLQRRLRCTTMARTATLTQMADAAQELHVVRVQLTSDELEWLRALASRRRFGEGEMLAALVRAARGDWDARQSQARERLLEYLGDAAALEPDEEDAILREIESDR